MRSLARTSLGLLGLALIAPGDAGAQYAPAQYPPGYQAVAPYAPAPSASSAPAAAVAPDAAPMGLDGGPMAAPAAEAPHKHKGRTICANCAAKQKAMNPAMVGKTVGCAHYKGGDGPAICAKCRAKYQGKTGMIVANGGMPGKIIGCEHSKNGVCAACQAALNLPGEFVMATPQPAEAPGRAVASSSPSSSPSGSAYAARGGQPAQAQAAAYDAGMGEPAPVGVMQANFSPGAPMGAQAAYAPQAMPPGRAVVESSPGHDPYQGKSGPFPRPHILGHLFGWSGLGAEKAEARAWKKAEAHAMTTYDENGSSPVDEIPASMVFGKKSR